MSANFVHLRVHSDFSMMDGLNKVKPILAKVEELGMPAVAITDQMNMCGLVKYYSEAHSRGIKPIIGTDFWVQSEDFPDEPFRLTLLAMSNEGYKNITLLISKAYLRGHVHHKVVIDKQWLAEHAEGVILLSGGMKGDIGQLLVKNNPKMLEENLAFYINHFADRFYLEMVRTGRRGEEDYNHAAFALAEERGLPVVATNEVCFIDRDKFDAHEIRVCIHDGYTLDDKRRPKHYSEQQYLRSSDEMVALFEDIPEAIENTVEIAKRCNVTVRLGEYFLPQFPTGGMTTLKSLSLGLSVSSLSWGFIGFIQLSLLTLVSTLNWTFLYPLLVTMHFQERSPPGYPSKPFDGLSQSAVRV